MPGQLQIKVSRLLASSLAVAACVLGLLAPSLPAADTKKSSTEADEKAIRQSADEFVKAFNAADAKAIGLMWSEDSEYTDEAGQTFRGRAAIEKEYAAMLKAYPGSTMTVTVESVRLLGADIAVEKGIAKTKPGKGDLESGARYTVVHTRVGGKWLMSVGHDSAYVPASNEDYFKDLEWLIGDWAPDAKDANQLIQFQWMPGKNFIRCTFSETKDGKSTETGGQMIGWNPRLGKIVSWHFDAAGGFGNDIWTKDDKKWVIDAAGTHRDGSTSSSVNILTPGDGKSFTWQSVRRILDGVRLPDTGVVKFVKAKSSK